MTVKNNEKLFDNTADVIEMIGDVVIKSSENVIKEVGSQFSDEISFTYDKHKDVIKLYIHNKEVLEMKRDDLVLVAFKELITMQLV